ncbi:NADH-quinone oxidoreductase subunit NuoH [bacterium]|nr:NADH-quinone oxidoreductase subunit NuoH [bacterium]
MSEIIAFIIEKLVLISVLFGITLGIAAYATLAERKFAAFFQDRIGPDRAGPFGLLQPLADGVKFFFKEEFIPAASDKFLFVLGPALAMIAACMAIAVIPWGSAILVFGREVWLQITDLNIGLLYVFGVVSMGVYGIMIGGWSSNNKYSVLSAIRASSQMISYELAMGLALIALVMTTGTLSLREIVAQQAHGHWNIFFQPLGFFIFIICSFAETNRTPFDLPECETELIGGYHTEYSSMKLGFYLFAEYINMFVASAMMATLFFGGYQIPGLSHLPLPQTLSTLLGTVGLFAKIGFFMFLFIWVRWTFPRFRFDQLMRLGWKILLPLAMINVLITAVILLI